MDVIDNIENCCVSVTARDFRRAGYKVTIVAEATQRGIVSREGFLPLKKRRENHEKFGVGVTSLAKLLADLDKELNLPNKKTPTILCASRQSFNKDSQLAIG
jgi:hypothetical protein